MRKKIVVVTGSSGTIGTRLCEYLFTQKQFHIIPVDWKKNPWNNEINQRTVRVDLRNSAATFKKLPKQADQVIHLASNARVYDLVKEPKLACDNMLTTFNVLEYARHRAQGIIFASSREVYGGTSDYVHAEQKVDIRMCENSYAASKLAGEAMVWSYFRSYHLPFIIYRFANVYGMYDVSNRVIPFFLQKLSKNLPISIYGKDKLLDFTYIDDTIHGLTLGMNRFSKVCNNAYNIASGAGVRIVNLAHDLKNRLNSRSKISITDNRTGEMVRFVADIRLAKKRLGYRPLVTMRDGLDRSVEWYRSCGLVRPSAA